MKVGLVVEGGGMKCAYNAAILDAFLDHGIKFDYCIGVSGGAGNLASYLAGQRGRNLRFFTQHMHDPEYFGMKSFLKTGNFFGLKYIYGTLTNSTGKDPLNFPEFKNNPAEFEAVVTNALTGDAEYVGKDSMNQDDYRPFMASSAIPVACNPIEMNGIPYFDGGVSDSIPVFRALEKGCDKLVVILTKTRDYVKEPQGNRFIYSLKCHRFPKIISRIDNRHINYNKNMQDVFSLEEEGKAFVFAPSQKIQVGTATMDEQKEWDLYNLGMDDFKNQHNSLMTFLAE